MRLPGLNSQILLAASLGAILGVYLNHQGVADSGNVPLISALQFAGGLFVDLLKMVLIPLVFTSVASGVASLGEHEHAGRIWRTTLTYYLSTTLLAALLGLLLMNLFEPGKGLQLDLFQDVIKGVHPAQNLSLGEFLNSFLRGLFVNPVKAMAEGAIIPTVVFALITGIAMAQRGSRAHALRELLSESLEIILVIVNGIMKVAPIGVFALLGHLVATQPTGLFVNLAQFIAVAVGGLLIHGLVVLPALLFVISHCPPGRFFRRAQDAMLTAFATCSSSATLPITLRVARENLHVPPRIAKFVLPLGATMNMDGTALYEAGAALFVANLAGIDLNLAQQLLVCLMAVLASVGAPGLPSAGMVTMIMVLQSVGLPVEAIAILLPIDRLIDAVRTTVNVEGDLVGAVIIHHLLEPPVAR
jgi:Na+/H+-dicarboxylate symporter